jgi:hypothetical protein
LSPFLPPSLLIFFMRFHLLPVPSFHHLKWRKQTDIILQTLFVNNHRFCL